jgi:hypothetical protein
MSECTRLSDRMIAVAHGRAAWSADETAHFSECPDCLAEWQVVQRGAVLGAEVGRTLPADFIATRVVAGLRTGGAGWWQGFRLPQWRWLALPVVAAVSLALVVLPRGSGMPDSAAVAVEVADAGILPELDGLEESELESVLELLPAGEVREEIRSFDDLTADEVRRVLTSLEG